MSEVRCPMCSKVNLADAEVCEFCAARIKPLMLDPEDDQGKTEWSSAESRPHSETEEPVKEYEEEETLSVTSWLGQMREETPDFPDAEVQEDEDTHRTSEGLLHAQVDEVEVPASLHEYAETADDGIEWLNRFRAEGAADEEHAEDEPAPGAGQKLGESEELPDLEQPEGAPEISADDSWLADFRSEAIEEGEHLPEKEEVDQGEDDTLAWLRELTEQEEPVLESEPEFVSESQEDPVFESEPVVASEPSEEAPIIDSIPRTATPADQDVSLANYNFDAILDAREDESDTGAAEDKDAESTADWLSDFMEEKSDQQNKLAEDHAVEDIPEWLDQLQEKEAGLVAPWADVTAPLPHPELPDDSCISGPPDSDFPRQDTAWKELEDLVGKPDSPDSALDTPAIDWLSDEVPETSAQDVVEAEIPAADIPDWMEGIRERQSKETRMLPDVPESPSVEQAAEADVLDIPDTDWLSELTEEKTEQEAVDEQLSAADIPDWMEGLRERQSKETNKLTEVTAPLPAAELSDDTDMSGPPESEISRPDSEWQALEDLVGKPDSPDSVLDTPTIDWLSDEVPETSAQDVVEAEIPAADIPDWMEGIRERQSKETRMLPDVPESPSVEQAAEADVLDIPDTDWLSELTEEKTEQEAVDEQLSAADIPDWMEGLRERQSKETNKLTEVTAPLPAAELSDDTGISGPPESEISGPDSEWKALEDLDAEPDFTVGAPDTPDTEWLSELAEENFAQDAVAAQIPAADIPDWMEGIRERQSKETHLFVEPAAETEAQSVRTDQLPEGERTTGDDPARPVWLEDITETAFQDTDANAGQAAAAATDIPDWLGNIWEDHLDSQQSVKDLPVSSKDIPADEMGAMEEARSAEARFPESAHGLDDSDLSSEAGLPDGELPAATMPEWLSNIRDRQTKETGTLNDEGQLSDPDSGLSAGDPGAELVYSADMDQTLEPIESDESTAAIPGWLKEMHGRPGVEAGQLQPVDEEDALPGMHEQPETKETDSIPAGTDAGIPESTIDFSFLDEEATVEELVDEIAAPDWLTGLRTMPVQGDWPAADSESTVYETTEQEQKDAEAGVQQASQADDSPAEPDQSLQDERVLAESEASLAEIGKEIPQDEEPDAVHAELEFKPLEDVSFTPAAGLEEELPENISVADLFPPEPDADALAVGDSDLNAANMPDWLQGIHARQSKETRMLELPDEMKAPDLVADSEASSEFESTAIWPPPSISEQEKITTKESKKELDQLSRAVPSSDVVSEPAPSLTADSSALSDLQSEESGTRPVWLEDLPELTSIDRPSAPAFIPGVDMMADQSQDEVGEDEEQSPHWMDGVQADAAQAQVPEAFAGADLARATLPVWLEAMRPVESSSSIARDGEAVAEPVETAGPLAGLQGVLAAEPFMETPMAARTAGTSLLISEREYARSELLKRLIADEERELTSTIKQKDRMGLMRWITATILVLAVLIPALFGFPSYKQPVSEPLGLVRLFETVNSLPADNPALLIFDYEPGFAPEMEAVAGSILHHLAVRQIPMVTLATHPAGLPLADRLIQKTIDVNSFQMGEDYVHLGYLAGGSIGIQAFVAAPRSVVLSGYMLPEIYRQESGGVWTTPILSEVEKISDFGLVCVIASDAEAARDWIEQAGSSINNVPLLVAISYGAEPMIRPYYEGASAQVDGIIAGLPSAAAYDLRFNRTSDAQRLWNSYNTGVVAAFLIIVIGGGVNITRWILQNRRPPESESAE